MRRVVPVVLLLLLLCVGVNAAAPVWGAKQSMPANTPPAQLKPGQWIWGATTDGRGPMAVLVSLTEQLAYVYRNGVLIAVSTISSGRKGYETPTGVFTILQKDKNHRSNLYDNAPMPYQQRLTWDGIALHAGGLPGYPESHGCVHLPTEFARRLFAATNMGMTVVVSAEGESPSEVVHPQAIAPIDAHTGMENSITPLASGENYRWEPEKAPEGPVSLVMSAPDHQVIVLRNGVEIGRANIAVRNPQPGTHAYIVAQGPSTNKMPGLSGMRMPSWITIGIPDHNDRSGRVLEIAEHDNIAVPPAFMAKLLPILTPGTVLLSTDQSILPQTSGVKLKVLDDESPISTVTH